MNSVHGTLAPDPAALISPVDAAEVSDDWQVAPQPAMGWRRRTWLLAGAALVLAASIAAVVVWRQGPPARLPVATAVPVTPMAEPVALAAGEFRLSPNELRALRIEPVGTREFRAERVAEGRITLNEDRATPIFAPYTGRVLRALARVGDTVAAGDTLFELETGDLAGAAGDLLTATDGLSKARTTLDQARREERRQADLLGARATSQRDVEQARSTALNAAADLRTAEATLAAARDKLRVLGRSSDDIRRIEVGRGVDAVVRVAAPIGGSVVQRRLGPGQWLSAGGADPVFTIADLSTVWLVAAVRELDAPLIRPGQALDVTVGALPGRRFDARVATVGAGLDPLTRRLTVRAEVDDPEGLLKPEMFATFRIAVGDATRAVAVPANAIIHRGAEASVWVALEDHRFILRRIRTGTRAGETVAVTEGLAPGEQVVTGGALFIDRAARID